MLIPIYNGVFFVSLTVYCCKSLDQASFYGNSFIYLPLKEAKSYTDIGFKFCTYLPDSLILLVTGSTDYCIISLDSGKIKLNINLGSGEFEIITPPYLLFNDNKWHEVRVARREGNLSLVIDNKHSVKKGLPGKFFELNIHNGLFVGGRGNYSEMFFGHQEYFRGCLEDLDYNGISVLQKSRHRLIPMTIVQGVTWNCASEFNADLQQPISFIKDGAFMNLLMPELDFSIWELEIKTLSEKEAILLYHSGSPTKLDDFLLEIFNGKVRISIEVGGNKFVDGTNDIFVADGHWHKITIQMTSTSLELNIDSHKKIIHISKLAAYFVDMNNILHVGGIDISKRAKVSSKRLKVPEGSFKGCMRNLKIGDHLLGLQDARITEGLLNGCIWKFPCLTGNFCSDKGVCVQQGLDSYHCRCQLDICTNSSDQTITRGNIATDLELLILKPLNVIEGHNVLITTNNLHVVFDFPKFGITEFSIIFHVIDAPQHGNVMIDVWPHEKNSFTLSDIANDNIFYAHDGSEHNQDYIVMTVEFLATDVYVLPAYLHGRFLVQLNITITPVNDAPQLNILATSVLRLAQGSKKVLTRETLQANDPDTSPNQLIYTVVESPAGHLEHVQKLGIPIFLFSQKEVDTEEIVFIHNASSSDNSYLSLQVSDGIEISQVSKLKISAIPHYLRIENNTGVIVMHNGYSVISNFNLSFTSNVPRAVDETCYYIIEEPKHGIIETNSTNNIWKKTIAFSSEDLRKHYIRYRHTNSKPSYDEFQFHTSLNGTKIYAFKIIFQKCSLLKMHSTPLCLEDVQQSSLTTKQLEYKMLPAPTSTEAIIFIINTVPLYGYLFKEESKHCLHVGDSFTQRDINMGNINYKLHHKTYSYISDSFIYSVMIHGCNNVTGNITVEYFPSADTASQINVILQTVKVHEGREVGILPANLNIMSGLVTNLIFNISENPVFGSLQIRNMGIFRNKTKFFTADELNSNKLFYIHDDSESKQDFFHFVASSLSENEDFQYVGILYIDVLLINDNSPIRIVEQVFHVVIGGQKLLTGNDLRFVDADMDTLPSDIIYTCQELSNGQFYSSKNLSIKLNEFLQKDLDEGAVLFKHNGSELGKAKLWVTDGHFYVEALLEIHASAPFVEIYNSKKLIVEQNGQVVISKDYLLARTNLFALDNDILYEVIKKSIHGKIIHKNLYEIRNFTQSDVNDGKIIYVNKRLTDAGTDHLELRISCKDVINNTVLNMWILPASFWEPLAVKSSCTLIVEEYTSAIIDNKILEVFLENMPANSITYYISIYAQNGYLSIAPVFENENNTSSISSFTQALVNENRLVYVHFRSNTTKDNVLFNITNGIVWLYGLVLDIEIIPEHISLGSNGITVNEGGTIVLTETQLFVNTDYYKSKMTEYIILQQPSFGWMESMDNSNKISGFTYNEFIKGNIKYTHDNSENLQDKFVIIGAAGSKKSVSLVIVVNVKPMNDNYPQLVNNTGLTMWEGGVSVISSSMLATTDLDYPPNIVLYQVLGSWWGNVSLISETTTSLKFFTQELINKGLVVFRHQNGTDAKFVFNISDGLHSAGEYSFFIKTKPVVIESLKLSVLHVFPLQKKLITSSHLFATVSEPNRTVHFKITSPLSLGRLIIPSNIKENTFRVINKFTQADIDNSKIYYEHTHPFEDLYAEDIFIFNVEAHLAPPIINQKFKIEISVSSGGLDAYIKFNNIKVDEGGIASIKMNLTGVILFLENNAGLKSPILHASVNIHSLHGQVFLQQSPNVTTFTQQQLESGQIFYQHDHSDSLNDKVYFLLYILPGYIALCNVSIPVQINPINDQPFKLITPAPHFIVVQGENHTITSNELATEDADTSPEFILYDIISMPACGRIILVPEGFNASHFTQEDINLGRLVYVHNGLFMSDMFHLRVWDGKFRPDFTVMNIYIIPVSLNVSIGLPLYLQQGSNVLLLSRKQFIVETNANINKIQYNIKEGPKHGLLYVKDAPASVFGQNELDGDDVMYMQTDMTAANDSIKIYCYLLSGNISIGDEVEILIKVQPLMQIKNFTVLSGSINRITKDIIDATSLAKLTNSNPHYTIVRYPQYCQIRKIIRSSGEKRNVLNIPVSSFTHEEILSGLIYLITNDLNIGWESIRDEMVFVLAGSIFQPASGKLKIIIKSAMNDNTHSTLASPNDPAGREGGMRIASPNMTRDYLLIVSMIVGVVILGIAVIIIIKCHTLEPDISKERSLQPVPLPKPPDALMTSSTRQHVHDGFTTLSAALPQCKVTPLNETHAGYPYGIEEHISDWTSCDASDPSCQTKHNIMLRRNQYWV